MRNTSDTALSSQPTEGNCIKRIRYLDTTLFPLCIYFRDVITVPLIHLFYFTTGYLYKTLSYHRTGKVKGLERIKGAVEGPEPALMEVTSGQAKYEHQHRAIVWRMSRLPKEGQGAYTMHNFSCRMNLTAYDEKPEKLDR